MIGICLTTRQYVNEVGGPLSSEEEIAKTEGQVRVLENKNAVDEQAFSREGYQEALTDELKVSI